MTIAEAKTMAVETTTDVTDTTRGVGSEFADQARSAAGQVRDTVGGAMNRVPDVMESARNGAEQVAERMPVAVEQARLGAQRTTISLQALPDTTLRLLAGASIGMAAGLSLAGAPRLVALASLVPALFVGSALATRPTTERES